MTRIPPSDTTNIFLVEDDEDLRAHVEATLFEAGYHVISTTNVIDARFKVKNQKFDLLILDFRIKGMTSEDIIISVRDKKSEINFVTPILMISANLDLEILKRIRPMISGALVKPFGTQEFLDRVDQLVKESKARAAIEGGK